MSAISQGHQQQRSLYEQLLKQLESPNDNDDSTGTSFTIPKSVNNPNIGGTGAPVTIRELQKQNQLDLYNQPNNVDDVYRYMKYYFIYKKGDKSKERISLPIEGSRNITIVIAGYLVPPPSSTVTPLFVTLEHNAQELAVIDFSNQNRGYWIQSNSPKGWYYLQEPCDFIPPGGKKSQAAVQWETTVTLTCISALLDQKLLLDTSSVDRSIRDILPLLYSTDNCHEEKDLSVLANFELDIVANYKATIHEHMNNCIENCTRKCNLMKSIDKLRKPKHAPNTTAVQLWVQLMSLVLHRHMWGGPATMDTASLPMKRQNPVPGEDSRTVRPKISNFAEQIELQRDKDRFSAVALREQLCDSESRIPNVLFDNKIAMDEWNETTSWDSIVKEHASYCRFGTDKKDLEDENDLTKHAENFFNHIMEVETINEIIVFAIFALSRLEDTSRSYKLLLQHKNSAKQRPVTFIFENLRARALNQINQNIKKGNYIEGLSAMFLLANILLLVASRTDIANSKHLALLDKKANVDLDKCLKEVETCIETMNGKNILVPKYLQTSFDMAKNKLSEIIKKSDAEKELKTIANQPNRVNTSISAHVLAEERGIPRKSESNQQTSSSGLLEKRIPKKGSNETNAPTKSNNYEQPLNSSKQSTSVFSSILKGISKDYGKTLKKEPSMYPAPMYRLDTTNDNINSIFSQNDDRKQPPRQYSQHKITWESSNICGWGDIKDILLNSNVKSLPLVAEVIKKEKEQRCSINKNND